MKTERKCSVCGKKVENKYDCPGWVRITYDMDISHGYTVLGTGRGRRVQGKKKDFCGPNCLGQFFNELITRAWT